MMQVNLLKGPMTWRPRHDLKFSTSSSSRCPMAARRVSAASSCAREEKKRGKKFFSKSRETGARGGDERVSEVPLLGNGDWRCPGNRIPAQLRKADRPDRLALKLLWALLLRAVALLISVGFYYRVFFRKAPEAPPNPRAMEVAMSKDLQQEASLAKKRYMDLCRQGRIFDARNRIIGVRH